MGLCQKIREMQLKKWLKAGLRIGTNVKIEKGVSIDPSFPWLITIGNNVTIAPNVIVLAHDASSQVHLGYTRLGEVTIGNNVFIGTKTTILPGVSIGDNVVVAAGSLVNKDVPSNTVVGGCPAKVIKNIDAFKDKHRALMDSGCCYDESYTLYGGITDQKKNEMLNQLKNGSAYVK